MPKVNYINVNVSDVQRVKKKVFSLPEGKRKQYYPLLNSLRNNFYGSVKSLSDKQLKQYNELRGCQNVKKLKAK